MSVAAAFVPRSVAILAVAPRRTGVGQRLIRSRGHDPNLADRRALGSGSGSNARDHPHARPGTAESRTGLIERRARPRRTRRYENHAIRIGETGEAGDEVESPRLEPPVRLCFADPKAVAVAREDVDFEPVATFRR